MTILIILAAVIYYMYTKGQVSSGSVPSLAGQNLTGVTTPGASSSTAPVNDATPVFYQESNAATDAEPATTQSFSPIDLSMITSMENAQGIVAPAVKTPTAPHTNFIIASKLNVGKYIMAGTAGDTYPNSTQLTSVSEEIENTTGLGTPDNPAASSQIAFQSNPIVATPAVSAAPSMAPHATVAPSSLAPVTQKQLPFEYAVIKIAQALAKQSTVVPLSNKSYGSSNVPIGGGLS